MGIRVALHHKTVYQYDRPVTLSPQVVRLRPAPHSRTPVHSYSLRIEPSGHFINWQQDPQGNYLARLSFPAETTVFSLEVDLVAEMTVVNPFDFFLDPSAESVPFAYDDLQRAELEPFLHVGPVGPRLASLLASVPHTHPHTVGFLVDLNRRIQSEVRYLIRMEPGVQTSELTLANASGSCRDSAWLLVETLRHLGMAARFVSGYLIQLVPDQRPLDGPAGPPQDFTDLHAWAEVYLPGAGWVGLDPTSGLFAGEGHIPLAATPNAESAAPVAGLVSPSRVEFHHEMSVTRIHEDPRVTKPYSDAQWRDILALGDRVDTELAAGDVRLTMGGEPTFVSIDDMDGEEWNTAATGPTKRGLAGALLKRVRASFAPGGLLHYGQGKWYPGESLPRWAFTCFWRTDGVALWRDAALAADDDRDYGYGTAEARAFAEALAERLSVGRDHVLTAFEDPLAYVHKERQLPVNVDPEENTLDDPEERERLRRVFSRGLGTPTGFVLPLARVPGKDGPLWQSGLWMLRAKHLFLVPGDSAIGFRLPMESLPAGRAFDVFPIDPMSAWTPLPAPGAATPAPFAVAAASRRGPGQAALTAEQARERRQAQNEQQAPGSRPQAPGALPLVRTALTVEARDGKVCVFLPPVSRRATTWI